MLEMWDVWDIGCLGCGMFGMWNVWDVGCLGCGMFGMWDVGCGMFAGMWDVDLQNAKYMLIYKYLLQDNSKALGFKQYSEQVFKLKQFLKNQKRSYRASTSIPSNQHQINACQQNVLIH